MKIGQKRFAKLIVHIMDGERRWKETGKGDRIGSVVLGGERWAGQREENGK